MCIKSARAALVLFGDMQCVRQSHRRVTRIYNTCMYTHTCTHKQFYGPIDKRASFYFTFLFCIVCLSQSAHLRKPSAFVCFLCTLSALSTFLHCNARLYVTFTFHLLRALINIIPYQLLHLNCLN